MTSGLDVSNHNGEFDWNAWNGHIEFAMCKASEGITYHDPQFMRNWDSMMQLGLNRFAYHYFHPDVNPTRQAEYFHDIVRSAGLGQHDNFALDLEETDGLPPVEVSFAAYVFCQELKLLAPGHKILVYTYPAFAEAGNCAKLGGFPLWIANYDTPAPHIPPPWDTWTFWQSSANNIGRDQYNGTVKALDTWCGDTEPKYLSVKVAKWSQPPAWNSTLSGIAAHYHVPGGWPVLAEINHITNPAAIQPGQEILVPA